jgi:hypothetical protein
MITHGKRDARIHTERETCTHVRVRTRPTLTGGTVTVTGPGTTTTTGPSTASATSIPTGEHTRARARYKRTHTPPPSQTLPWALGVRAAKGRLTTCHWQLFPWPKHHCVHTPPPSAPSGGKPAVASTSSSSSSGGEAPHSRSARGLPPMHAGHAVCLFSLWVALMIALMGCSAGCSGGCSVCCSRLAPAREPAGPMPPHPPARPPAYPRLLSGASNTPRLTRAPRPPLRHHHHARVRHVCHAPRALPPSHRKLHFSGVHRVRRDRPPGVPRARGSTAVTAHTRASRCASAQTHVTTAPLLPPPSPN